MLALGKGGSSGSEKNVGGLRKKKREGQKVANQIRARGGVSVEGERSGWWLLERKKKEEKMLPQRSDIPPRLKKKKKSHPRGSRRRGGGERCVLGNVIDPRMRGVCD